MFPSACALYYNLHRVILQHFEPLAWLAGKLSLVALCWEMLTRIAALEDREIASNDKHVIYQSDSICDLTCHI